MLRTFRDTHNAAPVYALHASASTGGQWRALADEMSSRRTVRTPDLPGCGKAPDALNTGVLGLARDAQPVIAQIEAEGQPVHLVGHSFGGAVALKIAIDRPDLVRSLALFEPAAWQLLWLDTAEEDDSLFLRIFGAANQLQNALDGRDAQGAMAGFVDFWNGAGSWECMTGEQQQKLAARAPRVRKDFSAIAAERWGVEELSRIMVPTLIMTGLASEPAAQRVAERIAKAIPSAFLALLPETGHMAPITEPGPINRRIAAHVATAERADMAATELAVAA